MSGFWKEQSSGGSGGGTDVSALQTQIANVNTKTNNHISNTNVHITDEEKTTLTNVTSHVNNNDIHVTSIEKTAYNNHLSATDIHVTSSDKENINKAHTHTNKTQLDKISEDSNGNLLYNGEKIKSDNTLTETQLEAINKIDDIETQVNTNKTNINTINQSITNKVDKVEGKTLTTNDLTNTLKTNYDNAVNKAHEHTNKSVLDKLTDDAGKLLYNGKEISSGTTGGTGADGEDGATFIPNVDTEGNLSWTNDKGLTNPTPVNIKGPKGDKGDKGDKGEPGTNGTDGTNGVNGVDGVTPTLTIGTVSTLSAGTNATATLTGDGPNYTLNIGIPRGADGSNQGSVSQSDIDTAVSNYLNEHPVSAEVGVNSVTLDSLNKSTLYGQSVTITENTNQDYKLIKLATPINTANKVIKVTADAIMASRIDLKLATYPSTSNSSNATSNQVILRDNTLTQAEFIITTPSSEVVYIGLKKTYTNQSNVGTIDNIKVYVDDKIVGYTLESPTSGTVIINDESNAYLVNTNTLKKSINTVNEKFNNISLNSINKNVFAKDFTITTEIPTTNTPVFIFDKPIEDNSVIKIVGTLKYNVTAHTDIRISTDSTTTGNGSVTKRFRKDQNQIALNIEFTSLGVGTSIVFRKISGSLITVGMEFTDIEIYVNGNAVGYSLNTTYLTENTKITTIASKNYVDNVLNKVLGRIEGLATKVYHIINPIAINGNITDTILFSEYIELKKDDEVTLTGRIIVVGGKAGLSETTTLRVSLDTSYLQSDDLRNHMRDEDNNLITNKPCEFSYKWTISKDTDFIRYLSIIANGTVDIYLYDLTLSVNGYTYTTDHLESKNSNSIEIENSSALTIATKEYVDMRMNGPIKSDYSFPFVNTLYTVGASATDREFALPIFIDYCYGDYKTVSTLTRILFRGTNRKPSPFPQLLDDRAYLYAKRDSGTKIKNIKKEIELYSQAYNVAPLKFNHVLIDESISNGTIHMLTIGDSVTAGAVTKKQYWRVCAEYFAKEDLALNKTSDVLMLGSNNCCTDEVTYGGKTKTVTAAACGISSWSLNSWLTNVSTTTDYSNPGGLNGFTYVDDNGETQFSILKWVERFRNYTDDGVKLELGDERLGTWITADNIDKVQCCTPTHLYINSTHNGGTIEEHMKIIQIAQQEIPGIKIIVGSPMPLLGSWNIDLYKDDWIFNGYEDGPNYSGQQCGNRYEYLKHWTKTEREKTLENYYYFPQNVITPTIEAYEYNEIDVGFKKMKRITNQSMPKEHPGTYCHKIWGYELYALLKYIAGKEQNVTTNEVTVTLDTTNVTLTIGNTQTLTATPSTADTTVIFTSTDETIATVSDTGVITGVSSGECYIYAETSTSILPTVCKVTVTETTTG